MPPILTISCLIMYRWGSCPSPAILHTTQKALHMMEVTVDWRYDTCNLCKLMRKIPLQAVSHPMLFTQDISSYYRPCFI